MRRTVKFFLPALATSLALAACGSSSSGSSSQASAPATSSAPATTAAASTEATVKTASNAAVGGTVLVNSKGLTLYSLSGESKANFLCTSAECVAIWHPLTVASAATPSGAVGSLEAVKRPDGTEQLAYKGMPLYTFAEDSAPGQAKGQGIKSDGGTWTAVTTGASGAPATQSSQSAPAPASESSSSGGSGGYAY